ncbi:MAG: hypothetical protein K6E68_07535 [Lachnospiraceae bacterium]|nr:hypothetical protein [Lachnospiraceae bacterium]
MMNDESMKLEAVRRSCMVARIASRIVTIIFIIGTVMALTGACVLIFNYKATDAEIAQRYSGIEEEKDVTVGKYHIGTIGKDGITVDKKMEITTSVPSLKASFAERSGSLSYVLGMHVLLIAAIALILTVASVLIMNVFDIIIKEGNPFTEKVKMRMLAALLAVSVAIFMLLGIGFGIMCAITTWAVYTIMDYGCILKIQSDETL